MGYSPGIRFFDTGQHFQQGGLATAVDTDDADAVAGLHAEGDIIQQGLETEGFGNCF